jgi:hypothetical protein
MPVPLPALCVAISAAEKKRGSGNCSEGRSARGGGESSLYSHVLILLLIDFRRWDSKALGTDSNCPSWPRLRGQCHD